MKLPNGAKIIARGEEVILAQGEATGHAHRVMGKSVLIEYQGRRYLVADGEVSEVGTVTHEEHGVQALDEFLYAVSPQQQFDLSDEWVRVVD